MYYFKTLRKLSQLVRLWLKGMYGRGEGKRRDGNKQLQASTGIFLLTDSKMPPSLLLSSPSFLLQLLELASPMGMYSLEKKCHFLTYHPRTPRAGLLIPTSQQRQT